MYCEQCKKHTNFVKTNNIFYKDAIVECTVCKSLHAIPISAVQADQVKK